MENNAQYMMLNNKLKTTKKSLKKQAKETKKKIKDSNNIDTHGKSKFFEKYSDRIKSIQEADLKQKEKMAKNKKR